MVAGSPALVDRAREAGVDAVFVPSPRDYADPGTLFAVLAAHHAARRFDRVLSTTPAGLLPAAAVAERLGVRGNSRRCVLLLEDRAALRRLLNSYGLGVVRAGVVRSAEDLLRFTERVGGAAVVRPVHGDGEHLVATPADAADAWRELRARGAFEALAEERLDGPEVAVVTFSHHGEHAVLAAAGAAAERPAVVDLVRGLLNLVGLREGPARTEVALTPAGPRVLRIRAAIGEEDAPDLDLARLTVTVPLGLVRPPLDRPPRPAALR